MANLRVLVCTILLFQLFLPTASFAYDRQTHEGITDAIVKSYEKLHGDAFSGTDESRIVAGSSAEDDDWRFLNHFYDPINYRGLTEFGIALGAPSEEWAQDTRGQASWRCIAYLPCSHNLGYNDKLFTSTTDYSWDRDIYEYVYGDKQRALEGLGHVLHVLEDATVPAHVRNDQHGHIGSIGDPDPYETFTSQFSVGSVPIPKNLTNIPQYSDLNSYLDHVAFFTATRFVSKDTLFNGYAKPSLNNLRIINGFAEDVDGNKIAEVLTVTDPISSKVINQKISIDDALFDVAESDWRALSQKAVLGGVGVIDLFFKKAEEERRTGAIRAKNVSAADENMKELASKGFGIVKALYGSSLQQSDVDELLDEGGGVQSAAAALVVQGTTQAPQPTTPPVTPPAAPTQPSNAVTPKPPAPAPKPIVAPISTPKSSNSGAGAGIPQPLQSQGISPGYGGGAAPAPTTIQAPDSPAPSPLALTIVSPLDTMVFGTTSVTFTGTSEGAAAVVAAFESTTATSSIDVDGNWTVTLNLLEGTTAVTLTAENAAGNDSVTAERDISVDLTPTDATMVTIPVCQFSLAAGSCVVATNSVAVNWGDVDGATSYALATNGILGPITSATSAVASLAYGATTSVSVVSYDVAGNAATSSAVFVGAVELPLIFNEIGWGGTDTSAADQWIEIKNNSPIDIDLSHVALLFSDGSSAQLSGSIAGGQYVVVQPHSFVMNLNPLVVPFTLSTGPAEQMRLAWNTDGTDVVLDSTPAADACASWCAGEMSAPRGVSAGTASPPSFPLSMERIASDGTLASSWRSTDTYGSATWGTPGVANSSGLPMMGVYCGGANYLMGRSMPYDPGSGSCTFLSRQIPPLNNGSANRFGALYRGDVGSSTALMDNGQPLFRPAEDVAVNFQTVSPQPGEHFFFALWEKRSGPAFDYESQLFTMYFTTALLPDTLVPNPPHTNYLVMPFTYAP